MADLRRFHGLVLRRGRKAKGETAVATAYALGISESYIHLVECGHRIPKAATLDAWCRHLGVPIEDCFVGADEVLA